MLTNSKYPIAYILIDCRSQEEDNEFLNKAIGLLHEFLEDCEINFVAYCSSKELVEKCVSIISGLQPTDHPVQLIWVSKGSFCSLDTEESLAILSLYSAMHESSVGAVRCVLFNCEGEDYPDWACLINSEFMCLHNTLALEREEWKVGWVSMNEVEVDVYASPSTSRFPVPDNHFGSIVGSIDRISIEPYLEVDYAFISTDSNIFDGKSVIILIGSDIYFTEPSSDCVFKLTKVSDRFSESVLKKVKIKKRPSIDNSQPQVPAVQDVAETTTSFKEKNKCQLKKLLLLSLRKAGISRTSKEFPSIWKHLYCGCVFALRRELDRVLIDQSSLIAVIQNNMRTFNIR